MPEDDVAEPEEDVMQLSLTLSHLATSQGFSDRWLFPLQTFLAERNSTLPNLPSFIYYIISYIPNFLCLTILHSVWNAQGCARSNATQALKNFHAAQICPLLGMSNRHVLRVSPCTRPTGECGGIAASGIVQQTLELLNW